MCIVLFNPKTLGREKKIPRKVINLTSSRFALVVGRAMLVDRVAGGGWYVKWFNFFSLAKLCRRERSSLPLHVLHMDRRGNKNTRPTKFNPVTFRRFEINNGIPSRTGEIIDLKLVDLFRYHPYFTSLTLLPRYCHPGCVAFDRGNQRSDFRKG